MPTATFRYSILRGVAAWRWGVELDGDDRSDGVLGDVAEAAAVVERFGLGRGSVDVREDVPSGSFDALLSVLGRAVRSAVPAHLEG